MHNVLNMNAITNQEEKEKSFEQYKMINDSIHQ
jgi:hypothetical protein